VNLGIKFLKWIFFGSTGVELRALCLLDRHSTTWTTPVALFCVGYFQDRVSCTIYLGWLQITILLISASWVARITGVSHWHPTWILREHSQTKSSIILRLLGSCYNSSRNMVPHNLRQKTTISLVGGGSPLLKSKELARSLPLMPHWETELHAHHSIIKKSDHHDVLYQSGFTLAT
jgi:hypothetical protein